MSGDVWTRTEVFGSRWTERSLSEFVATSSVDWVEHNPYVDIEPSETRAWLLNQRRWRYHHGIEELTTTATFYAAYSDRVEAMLGMVDTALDGSGVSARQLVIHRPGCSGGLHGEPPFRPRRS